MSRRFIVVALAPLLIGAAVGVAWQLVVEPWHWTVVGDRLAMGEIDSSKQFAAFVWFTGLGAAVSVIWGAVMAIFTPSSWKLVPGMIISTLVAAVIAWQLGVWLGPDDPESAKGFTDGEKVPAALVVDSLAAFLAWPIAALAGVLAGTIFHPGPGPRTEGSHAARR